MISLILPCLKELKTFINENGILKFLIYKEYIWLNKLIHFISLCYIDLYIYLYSIIEYKILLHIQIFK